MGMQMGGARESGGRGRRRRRQQPMSEINVTPFVDVMLVLLIIFMVAAPLLTVGVPLDLPETQAKPVDSVNEPITVSVAADGRVYIQETEIDPEELIAKPQAIAESGYEERIFVRGDENADYGTIMKVMARISAAGYKRLALVTLEEQQ